MHKSQKALQIMKTLQSLEQFIDKTNRHYWNANRIPPLCLAERTMIGKLRDKLERHNFWRSI